LRDVNDLYALGEPGELVGDTDSLIALSLIYKKFVHYLGRADVVKCQGSTEKIF
jgi:hypothetical protein